MFDLRRGKSFGSGLHQKSAHFLVHLRPDNGHVGNRSVRNPRFGAAQHPAVLLPDGPGDHASGIGAVVRFCETEAPYLLPGGELRKPESLLLLGAEGIDGIHHQCALYGSETSQSAISSLQFLHHQSVRNVVHAGATVLFGQGRSKQPEVRHLRNEIHGKGRFFKVPVDGWNDLFAYKGAYRIPDHSFFF